MRIRRRPMQVRDVQACVQLTASHPLERERYGNLLSQLLPAWKALVHSGSPISGVLEDADSDNRCVLGFGLSVFVTDEFLRHCKSPSLRWVGPEVLRWQMRGDSPILGTKAIRDANSSGGLNSVAWAAALAPRNERERAPLQIELMNAFMHEHRGFLLKEVFAQPIELCMMEIVLNSGGLLWDPNRGCCIEDFSGSIGELMRRPFALVADSESATRRLNWATTLFQYTKPRIYFRPAEQRLLLAALKGATDKELSDELGVSLSFIKKTWLSIYNRAAEMLLDLRLTMSADAASHRGKEKKQHLLSYLRDHPEELRPLALPIKGRAHRNLDL
jgi:hypothetical protein